jgi:hypothetical protein
MNSRFWEFFLTAGCASQADAAAAVYLIEWSIISYDTNQYTGPAGFVRGRWQDRSSLNRPVTHAKFRLTRLAPAVSIPPQKMYVLASTRYQCDALQDQDLRKHPINRLSHRRHSGWDAGIQRPEPAPAKAGGRQASGFPLEFTLAQAGAGMTSCVSPEDIDALCRFIDCGAPAL